MTHSTLVLGRQDIDGLLDLETARIVLGDVLRVQAAGRVVARAPMHVNVPDGALRILSGALTGSSVMGIRTTGAQGLARDSGAAMLWDAVTADLLCVLAYPFGTLRTAAILSLAIEALAPPESSSLAMIGSGRNALGLLRGAKTVRSIETVTVYGRNREKLAAFAAAAQKELGIAVQAGVLDEEKVIVSDIVLVATDAPNPIVSADAVDTTFIGGMGLPSEFDASLYLEADQVVVTSVAQEQGFRDSQRDTAKRSVLAELDEAGDLPWSALIELGQILAEDVRRRPGRVVFRESGGGYSDVALANYVYQRARELGLGSEIILD